jgi:hypothetical protein
MTQEFGQIGIGRPDSGRQVQLEVYQYRERLLQLCSDNSQRGPFPKKLDLAYTIVVFERGINAIIADDSYSEMAQYNDGQWWPDIQHLLDSGFGCPCDSQIQPTW